MTEETQSSEYLPHQAIFRAYDIQGIVEEQLHATNVRLIGQSIGSEALDACISRSLAMVDFQAQIYAEPSLRTRDVLASTSQIKARSAHHKSVRQVERLIADKTTDGSIFYFNREQCVLKGC